MAALPNQGDEYELTMLLLVGGVLYARYKRGDEIFKAQICNVLSAEPFAIITTGSITISRPFRLAHLINDRFYVVSKTRDENGQVEGRKYGEETWLPIRRNANDALYVEYPNTGEVRLVIMESSRPFTTLEKAGIGIGIAVGAVGGGALAIFAAPFAIAGLGFGVGGIAAGSTAATMMSLGVVGVATLQSIGAAGMGVASMIIVGGTGAVMAGGVAGGVAVGVVGGAGGAGADVGDDGAGVVVFEIIDGMLVLYLFRNGQNVPLPPLKEFLDFRKIQ